MKHCLTLVRTLLVGGAFAACAVAAGTESLTQQLNRIVEEGIHAKQYPGAVLIVGTPNGMVHASGYGRHTYQVEAQAITTSTIFDLASVSKVVGTATAAMKLVEEGRLNLGDPVARYVPDWTTGGKELVTVKDLLTHVSGLKSYDSAANAEKLKRAGQSNAEALIQRIASLPTSYPPRSKTTYSCLNMLTMASVNERVLGGTMDEYLRAKVYGPIGMVDTTWQLSPEQLTRTAPTVLGADGVPNTGRVHDPLANYYIDAQNCPGNAGLFSTAPDLAAYCAMILNEGQAGGEQVFQPETVRLMTSLQSPEGVTNLRGLGWDIQVREPNCTPFNQSDETRVISHMGYTGTMVWLDKLSRTFIVFLTNRTLGEEPGESKGSVEKARRDIVRAVLRSRPEYVEHYATVPAEAAREKAPGN